MNTDNTLGDASCNSNNSIVPANAARKDGKVQNFDEDSVIQSGAMAVQTSTGQTPISGGADFSCLAGASTYVQRTDASDASHHPKNSHHVPGQIIQSHDITTTTDQTSAEDLLLNINNVPSFHESSVSTELTQSTESPNVMCMNSHRMTMTAENLATATLEDDDSSIAETHEDDDDGMSDSEEKDETAGGAGTKKSRRKRALQLKPGQTAGRWTPEEHQAFLEGLKVFGREWKKVAERIPTRTSAQIRSHAQKYFAKIVRDESIMLQDQAAAVGPIHAQSFSVAAENGAPPVPPSVQQTVHHILANPNDVQRQVEDTMRELRERYRQLQLRLQETSRTNRQGNGVPRGRPNVRRIDTDRHPRPPVEHRKRALEVDRAQYQDDLSSVSSTVSHISPTRELGSEELIALSVLGGALPRSASNQDLPPASGHSSPTSTIASNNAADSSSSGDQSKKRKVSEEPSVANNNDDNDDDDMVL